MKTIVATIKGNQKDLEMLKFSGIKNASSIFIGISTLRAEFIYETLTSNEAINDVMGSINMREVDLWNCEVKSVSEINL